MKIASLADVKAHFSAYVNASEQGPVVVTRNGKAVAVLLAVSGEHDLERLLMAHSPRLRAVLDAAKQRIQSGKGIPADEFWAAPVAEKTTRKRGGARRRPA
jgi:prevent-host-death family protein